MTFTVRPLPCILGGYLKSENEHQRRQVLIARTNINANGTPVPPTRCILKSGKFGNILYGIHFINLNDLKLKIICKRIKIQQEFLNMNHNEQLNTVLLHGEK